MTIFSPTAAGPGLEQKRLDTIVQSGNWLLVLAGFAISLAGATDALFNARDSRSAATWIAVCLMWPLVGVLIYLLLGKNRIRTLARKLHSEHLQRYQWQSASTNTVGEALPSSLQAYEGLSTLAATAGNRPLLAGNAITALHNGDAAYPAMLQAIREAVQSVYLATYIFDTSSVGKEFIQALADAHSRGVEVRVLIDGVGEKYSFPTASRKLRALGVSVARYLPPGLLPPTFTLNLRNHRKLLIVDGKTAFTGGMNIRRGHVTAADADGPAVVDMHFRICGPVASQLLEVFVADWRFSSNDMIDPVNILWDVPALPGNSLCRVIADGPNDDVDKLVRVLVGAVSVARHSVSIINPYFLPPPELAIALQTAAYRGVAVRVILPERNNLPYVKWAMFHNLGELLASGIEIYMQRGAFVHTKLFVVDDCYVQVGSANLDPRSLRLNFEVAVEVYDRGFGAKMAAHFSACIANSWRLDLTALAGRNALARLRDGIFWLFSPYL